VSRLKGRLQGTVDMDRGFSSSSWAAWPDLAALRRSRKISVSEIAAVTRIRADYLTAIERGEFEKLPGGVYTTSYIRQYARIIDYAEEDLLALWRAKTGASTDDGIECQDEASPGSSWLRFFRRLIGLVS
jgi:cytoskeletal protein RodZ